MSLKEKVVDMERGMVLKYSIRMIVFVFILTSLQWTPCLFEPTTRNYDFKVQLKNVTKLCNSSTIVTVNGMFPGPTVYAQEGDTVIVKVTNQVSYNVTLHWHGVKQQRSCWADGPRYITQCPIQTGQTYTYTFTLIGQRGTLWWHAHIEWLRATVNGAMVIYPKTGVPYPFQFPTEEHVLILGEWWGSTNVATVEKALIASGGGPPISDAYLINGHPGPTYNCSAQDVWTMPVVKGKTYLMRVINAALNIEHFFGVAKHKITVVAVDAEYTKPHTVDKIIMTPGQTCDVLIRAYRSPSKDYYIGIKPYMSAPIPVNSRRSHAILRYQRTNSSFTSSFPPIRPQLPRMNDSASVLNNMRRIKSLNSQIYPAKVPQKVDRKLFFTIGLNQEICRRGQTCNGPNNTRFHASINNITFQVPNISLLLAHYNNIQGVFTSDFPDNPPRSFNYTGNSLTNLQSQFGTRVSILKYNQSVQLVIQGTNLTSAENHPIHLHGHNFYIVGFGTGNYPGPSNFNLVDPPSRNTIGVPANGWVAIRFIADNPGVWYLHCHLEIHLTWGLSMAFITLNGNGANQTLPPPPPDYPKC